MTPPPRPFGPDDIYAVRQVTDVDVGPDGRTAAYSVAWADRDTDRNRSVLRLIDRHGDHRPLTHGHADVAPRFAPDGRRLAFRRSEVDAPPQVVVLDLAGGEPVVVTDMADGVNEHLWLPDGSGLIVVAAVRPADQVDVDPDELAARPRRINSIDYRFNGRGWTHDRRHHLFRVEVGAEGGEATQITEGPADDGEPAVSPDGRMVAFVSAREHDAAFVGGSDIWTVATTGGEAVRLTDGTGTWGAPEFAAGGDRIVVLGHPGRTRVAIARPHTLSYEGRPQGGEAPELLVDVDVTARGVVGTWPRPSVLADGYLYAPGVRRGSVQVDRYAVEGREHRVVVDGRRTVTAATVAADGAVWFAASSATRPAELFRAQSDHEERLTSLSDPLLSALDVSEPIEVEVASADGTCVHGWVVQPPDSAPRTGEKRPGLVYVHGGPTAQYGWTFFDEFQVAAGAGYVVVAGNPRGSDGYGEAWATDIVGAFGGRDFQDVEALADHLAGLPDVDPDRIGIGGGSYGGFMSAWAIGHSDRYRAALVERALTNMPSFVGTSDLGVPFAESFLGPGASTDVERLRRHSPLTHAASITTPTLIVHSEQDWRCPPEQAEQLFVALKLAGTEVEFVRFPAEDHELTRGGRPSHRVERFHIVHDWFARHLGGTPTRPAGDS